MCKICSLSVFIVMKTNKEYFMKKVLLLTIAAASIILTSCGKLGFTAQLKFDVSDKCTTKAILNGHTDSGLDITWEEGDEIAFDIEIYQGSETSRNPISRLPLSTTDGKLVYQDGIWKIYVASGSSFVETESLSVSSPVLDSRVRISFLCTNGDVNKPDPNTFVSAWVQVIRFSEGPQTVLVQLPV